MIYVNGDSYACVSNGRVYADFLGEHFNTQAINAAIPGSCNSRIIRTTIRDLSRMSDKNIRAVISLTFPLRTEIWDQDLVETTRLGNDGEFTSIQMTNDKSWFYNQSYPTTGKYRDYAKQRLIWYSIEAETVTLLQNIWLLTTWLRSRKIKYVILSGPLQEPVSFDSDFIKDFYQAVLADPNVIDIFSQSFCEWCVKQGHRPIDNFTQEIHGKTYTIGHHGEAAHQAFSKFLIDNYL